MKDYHDHVKVMVLDGLMYLDTGNQGRILVIRIKAKGRGQTSSRSN